MFRKLGFLPLALALIAGGLWLNWQRTAPSHDRDWRADYERLPTVDRIEDRFNVGDIRNWSYAADGTVTEPAWIAREIDPQDLVRSYFIVEPFGAVDAIAHTMLGFEFSDGEVLVASIEARREEGEVYQPLKAAVLPVYEYIFVWTTERDMFGNSEFAAGDQLYLYEFSIPLDQQQAVLRAMLDETAEIMVAPRWYNTLFSNCTNVLARAVNKISPGAVPFDISWFLPGYADDFLFREGFLRATGDFEETAAAAHVSPHIRATYDIEDPVAFSARIRELMAAP